MAQMINDDQQQIQYVLNSEDYILDSSEINSEGLSDIIYSDGTRAILVNGQIIQGETQTVVVQDGVDLSQYYINDEGEQILVADEQDDSVGQALEGAEIVQYIDTEENTMEGHQVIYVNEEGYAIQEPDLSEYQIAESQQEDNPFPLKTVKLETQIVDLEELMRQQGEGDTAIIENLNEENRYQYAILKDGKLHIQSYSGEAFPVTTEVHRPQTSGTQKRQAKQPVLDISKVTGRNLLTGQTVTLHSYMDKLQRKIKNSTGAVSRGKMTSRTVLKRRNKQQEALKALLNKKITLGKTTSGKRLVAKIIHVEKKAVKDQTGNDDVEESSSRNKSCSESEDNSIDSANSEYDPLDLKQQESDPGMDVNDEPPNDTESQESSKDEADDPDSAKHKIVIQEKVVSKECFGQISRTLSGLMSMDSIRRKLEYKDLIVKVVEKKYVSSINGYTKNVSYSSGYMTCETTLTDDGEGVDNWCFQPDRNTKEAIFGESENADDEDGQENERYQETASITLMITQDETGERVIRVVLNPTHNNKCRLCSKTFRSNLQLRVHRNNVHKIRDGSKICEICNETFDDHKQLVEHRKVHIKDGKLFQCTVDGCGKYYLTAGRLKRHSTVHNVEMRPLQCSVCLHRCTSESGLKKHLMTHMNVKPFCCNVCEKSFSNQGDLNFHKRIHDPCKYYACDTCKRTFSRHSNLQRHMEIHKGSEDLFWCTICGCSYHYMSSLTRHVVQNHIKRTDPEPTEMAVEDS